MPTHGRAGPTLFLRTALRRHDPTPDADLLARFHAARDEDAFAALVARHGPAVRAVCRRVLGDPHRADDAVQAAFLILARKGHTLPRGASVGGWLVGVARRAALAARRTDARRAAREATVHPAPTTGGPDPDLRDAVEDAVASLPLHLRDPVVLCELEGVPRAVAARRLGVPEGTLSSRLAVARKRLADRLRRRGFAPAAAVVLLPLDPATVAAVARLAVGSEVPSRRVTELTEAVMRTTLLAKWKLAAGAVLAAVAAGLAADPAKPPVPRPAVAAKPTDEGRLVLAWNAIRFVTPDGREVARVTEADARRGGADLKENVSLGNDWKPHRWTVFMPCGPLHPSGSLPIFTRTGAAWLTPGDPAVRPLTRSDGSPLRFDREIVAWSPDGRYGIGRQSDSDLSRLEVGKLTHTLIDTHTGTLTPLPVPPDQDVLGWAPDGSWFLTRGGPGVGLFERLFSGDDRYKLCKVSRDGKSVEDLTPPAENVGQARLSPDGSKVLYHSYRVKDGVGQSELVVLDLRTRDRRAIPYPTDRAGFGLAWSPDGKRVAFATNHIPPGGPSDRFHKSELWVCDADGGNPRLVLTETAPAKAFMLHDWR
ncbi:MAG: sigma-70 family RNA polymerase sigma factor [Gemmataceae bacterium]